MNDAKQLNIRQLALLELVKRGIATSDIGFDFTVLSQEDWEYVINDSRYQAVELMSFEAAKDITELVPKKNFSVWFKDAAQIVANNFKVLQVQKNLIDLLNKNSIPYIILKGSASGFYYPDPETRSYGDVDFYVEPEYREKAKKLMVSSGYEIIDTKNIYHTSFKFLNVDLELHFDIARTPAGKSGEAFRNFLQDAEKKYIVSKNPDFNNPEPQIHGIIILLHTIHHFLTRGVGLRHLCDWACFVNETHNELFWKEELLPLLKKTGTLRFAAAITKTSSIYLGTKCPDWADEISPELCRDIINDILELGNFGRKNTARAMSTTMFLHETHGAVQGGKLSNLFKNLRDIVLNAYPITKRYPILFLFFFIWKSLKYMLLVIKNKRASLFEAGAYVKERKAIYDQFKLFDQLNEKE